MITDKFTLKLYLDADKFALGKTGKYFFFKDDVWKYEIFLRKYEYARNTNKKILRCYYAYRLRKLGTKLGFSISGNTFGPGLRINHYGLLIVNAQCKIGKWCDIHQGVNIGTNSHYDEKGNLTKEVPSIGDFVYIGPGAKLFGNIEISNNVRIGANTVVNKNVPSNSVAYGMPLFIKPISSKLLTVSSTEFEDQFLALYPQYREYLKNYK